MRIQPQIVVAGFSARLDLTAELTNQYRVTSPSLLRLPSRLQLAAQFRWFLQN